jgi:hypothetical protein
MKLSSYVLMGIGIAVKPMPPIMKRTIFITYVLGIKVCQRSDTTDDTFFIKNVLTWRRKLMGHTDGILFSCFGIPPGP